VGSGQWAAVGSKQWAVVGNLLLKSSGVILIPLLVKVTCYLIRYTFVIVTVLLQLLITDILNETE
jgi:hypothetical protein